MKHVIIDGQMWQTNAYFRGMGGYAFGLFSALTEIADDITITIVLNKNMLHDEARIQGIKEWLPNARIELLDLPFEPGPNCGEEERAIATLDAFVASHFKDESDVYYFIPALFMFQYSAVFPTQTRKLLLFHDLMPLIFREELGKYFPAHLYFPRFKTIFEADVVLANSQTTANDLLAYLGIDESRVVNIDGSLNERLVHDDSLDVEGDTILDRLHLRDKQYVLMPTGGLENKNNIRATQAFQIAREMLGADVQLVITSFFSDLSKKELHLIADDAVTFTDNIANEDLLVLYTNCTAVLMPSLYEGLGLPVLEGVAHNKPVVCSDIPVFREMPHFYEALYAFDPLDVESIAAALADALSLTDFTQKQQHYPTILEKYNWQRSARIFNDVALNEADRYAPRPSVAAKVAVLCADPRKSKDTAAFIQRMYGHFLQRGLEVVYFIDAGDDDVPGDTYAADYIRGMTLSYDIQDVHKTLKQDDFAYVLHVPSNDKQYANLMRTLLAIPGFVYIAHTDYSAVFEALHEKRLISGSQAAAERAIVELADKNDAFAQLSMLVGARGIITEPQLTGAVRKGMELVKSEVSILEVQPVKEENTPEDRKEQQAMYAKIAEYIEGKSHVE